MIGNFTPAQPDNCSISAVIFNGLSLQTTDGRPARLAVIDEDGNIIETGPTLARAVWETSIASYKNYLIGNGHMRVQTSPPGLKNKTQTA